MDLLLAVILPAAAFGLYCWFEHRTEQNRAKHFARQAQARAELQARQAAARAEAVRVLHPTSGIRPGTHLHIIRGDTETRRLYDWQAN